MDMDTSIEYGYIEVNDDPSISIDNNILIDQYKCSGTNTVAATSFGLTIPYEQTEDNMPDHMKNGNILQK